MNRLLVLLLASLLGTGCVVSDTCDAHTVWVDWPTFLRVADPGYQTSTACFTDIHHLNVWLDGVPQSAPCLDNAVGYTGVPTGGHFVQVEAVDVNGTPLMRDQRNVSISDSCSDQVVSTQPAESFVQLKYAVPGNACAQSPFDGSPAFMWFSIFDEVWGHTIARVDHLSAQAEDFTCDAVNGTGLILPAGSFTLDAIQETYVATATSYGAASAFCSAVPFDVIGGQDKRVDVALVDGASCAGF